MLFLMFCGLCVGVSGWWIFLFTDAVSKEGALHIHEIFANMLLVIAFVWFFDSMAAALWALGMI